MFETLTTEERKQLAAWLRRGAQHSLNEACLLAEAAQDRPSVLAAYDLPRAGYHAWFDMSIDASMAAVAVWHG